MTTNPTFKPSEGKREEFRKYLEKNGVMDALTKVLVNLYEEVDKPEDALEYIRDKLAIQAGIETHNQLKTKIEELESQVADLEQQIEQLRAEQTEEVPEGGEEQQPPVGEEEVPEGEEPAPPPPPPEEEEN